MQLRFLKLFHYEDQNCKSNHLIHLLTEPKETPHSMPVLGTAYTHQLQSYVTCTLLTDKLSIYKRN